MAFGEGVHPPKRSKELPDYILGATLGQPPGRCLCVRREQHDAYCQEWAPSVRSSSGGGTCMIGNSVADAGCDLPVPVPGASSRPIRWPSR